MEKSAGRGGRLRRWLRLCCSVVLLATLPLPARAADVVVADRTLVIEPSEGFCALDTEKRVDSLLLEEASNRQKGANQVVGYWVDCQRLEELRGGGDRLAPGSHVLILAQRKGLDGTAIEPFDMPLEDYLRTMKDYLINKGGMSRVDE